VFRLAFVEEFLNLGRKGIAFAQPPYPHMGIEDNHESAFQEASIGPVGSVYFTTLPRSALSTSEGFGEYGRIFRTGLP
jgi:hypothetical protein